MNDFLAFRKMITPIVIQVLFWVGIVVCFISAIIAFANKGALQGILLLLLGPIMVRIYCELLIVTFKILGSLEEIRKNTTKV